MLRRCRITGSVLAHDYARQLYPGLVVDTDEQLPGGGRLGDQIPDDALEPLEATIAPPLHNHMVTLAPPVTPQLRHRAPGRPAADVKE